MLDFLILLTYISILYYQHKKMIFYQNFVKFKLTFYNGKFQILQPSIDKNKILSQNTYALLKKYTSGCFIF